MIGVTNYGSSFIAAYLYIKAESARAWRWFIEQYARVYQLEAQPLKVVVADFGEGLRAAFLDSKLLTSTLQFCQWHAFQAIYKKINFRACLGRGYNRKRRIQIKDCIWLYLQAIIIEEFNYCREALLREITLDYQAYIKNYYILLEKYLVIYYIQRLLNLKAYLIQYRELNN